METEETVDPLNLCGATRSGMNLDGTNWAGAEIDEFELESGSLRRARATAGRWDRCTFIDCTMAGADLAGLFSRDVGLIRVNLDGARLTGSSWLRSRWRQVHFEGGVADSVSAHAASWRDVTLTGLSLREADFTGAGLKGVRFHECDLRGARFSGITAEGVRFSQCRLDQAQGIRDLRGARMAWSDAVSVLPSMAEELGIRVDSP